MPDVFISYKAEDRRRVEPLVQALQSDGLSVWWDEHLGTGEAWRETIEKQLDSATCVVVIWSKRSVGPEGRFVREEASRAQARNAYVPAIIDAVQPPLGFGESQATSLRGWRGDQADARYQAVLAAIRGRCGITSPQVTGAPARSAGIDRRTMVAGGAVATAAIAGIGGWALLRSDPAEAARGIAVLPFANLSGDSSQAYFSDGIAEELRSALARLAGLKVVGRTSSEAVRNDDAATAAKKLGVANILTGSVRQSPATIRVTAQLVNGRDGIEKWSNSYDRPPGDAIKIQTDIAEKVASALSIELGSSARDALAAGGTSNPDAQKLLFQALDASRRGDRPALSDGISLTNAAIKLDSRYADAYAWKALFTNWFASTYATNIPELFRIRGEAMDAAKVALRLAPDLGIAHRALAEIYRVVLNIAPAIGEYQRAIELSPGSGGALSDYAFVIANLGRSDEGLNLADRAVMLDPLNINSYFTKFGALLAAQKYGEAIDFAKDLEEDRPHLFNWPELVGLALIAQDKLPEALTYLQQAAPDNYNRLVGEAAILARTGRGNEVEAIVKRMRQLYGGAASYQYGEVFAQLGDKDRAFAALDQAWDIRDSGLIRLKQDFLIDPLRGDPRYDTLLGKMNFPA